MDILVTNKKHILYIGPTGTGKTVSILNNLKKNFNK